MCTLWPFTRHGWTPLRGFVGLTILAIVLAVVFGRPKDAAVLVMATALVLMAIYWYWLEDHGARNEAILRRRLVGYAELGSLSDEARPQRRPLTRAQHQILLGTLKKVEQKAASLAAILVFIAIAIVTVGASDMTDLCKGLVYYCLLIPLLPLFIALAFAFWQKDNLSFVGTGDRSDAEQLQNTLISDLLQKEHCFRFAIVCTIFYVAAGFATLLIATLFYT